MSRRVSVLPKFPELSEIGHHYAASIKSMTLFHSRKNPDFLSEFLTYTIQEVQQEKEDRLAEIDATLALTLLASIEATFRVDYLRRCYHKKKDPLSRHFRNLYKKYGARVSLEDELLTGWRQHGSVPPNLLDEIKGAFRYRHWLAHGRYWTPKLGRRYDFSQVFDLAEAVESCFPFERQ